MKFNIDSREFARAIGPPVEVATKNCREGFDGEGLLTIIAKKHKLEVLAHGGYACLRTTIPNAGTLKYNCKREGVVTVYATDIFNGLTTMEAGQVEIKSAPREVVITLLSDTSVKRTMELVNGEVRLPNVGTKFEQSVIVNKTIFAKGLKSVMFAPAVEDKMKTYQCVLFEASTKKKKQVLRFSAGTGGRFAVKSVEGNNIYNADEDIKIIFPKDNLSSIYKIVSSTSCDKVLVRTVLPNSIKRLPEQIMINLVVGDIEIALRIFGSEYFTKYPDIDETIEHKYSNRIYSDLKDWKNAIGGVEMTKRGHDSKIHNTEVVFDPDGKRFMVTTKTQHACTTPIKAVDVEGDANVVTGDKIWFRCNSRWLIEMTKRFKDGLIQFNFDSQENLNDIPEDKPKQMRPVLVKFPEREDKILNITEHFYMFFTVSTKE